MRQQQPPQNLDTDIETLQKFLRSMTLEEVASFMAIVYQAEAGA